MRLTMIVLAAVVVAGCGMTSADMAQTGAALQGFSQGMQAVP
jgi:hypothetical protein